MPRPCVSAQRPRGQQITRLIADYRRAQNFAIARYHGFDHAARFALGAGAVIFLKRPAQNLDRFMPPPCFDFGEPDMCEFRACIGDARHGVEIGARGQMKQNIADDNTGLISGRMGELWPARNITNGKNFAIGRAQPLIGSDAGLTGRCAGSFNTRRGQVQPCNIGEPRPVATNKCVPEILPADV